MSKALEKLEQIGFERLVDKIRKHPFTRECEDPEKIGEYVRTKHRWHYAEQLDDWAFHDVTDHPTSLDLTTVLHMAHQADEAEGGGLFKPKAWQRPANNPWLPEFFNLTVQGEVFKNDSALAARWKHEADVLKAQRAGRK